MPKESKFAKALNAVVKQYGEGRTDWIGAMAYDDSFSFWSLPIIGDVLDSFRPYFILLAAKDRIVISKISFRDQPISSQAVSKTDIKDFTFKRGMLSTKMRMTLPDGKKYKFSFMPSKLMLSHANKQSEALDIMEGFSK